VAYPYQSLLVLTAPVLYNLKLLY